VPRKPRLAGGVKELHIDEISFAGSPTVGGELHSRKDGRGIKKECSLQSVDET